jgi:hypothetical protein
MNNIYHGKVYKIVCNITNLIYIGSTIKSICARLAIHKYHYQKYLEGKSNYVTSFEIIKNGNYNIFLVENVSYSNKKDLRAKERYYIETLDCVNKNIPCQTKKEYYGKYYEKNHDKIRDRMKIYRIEHKDQTKEYKKLYKEKNREKLNIYRNTKFECECGGSYSRKHKAEHFRCKKHIDFFLKRDNTVLEI